VRGIVGARAQAGRGQRGAAAVEFALVLPIFLVIVFGILQYSVYFFSAQSGAAAAREAARRAAVGDQTCPELLSATQENVKLRDGAVTVTRRYYAYTDSAFVTPVVAAVGTNVRVQVDYRTLDFNFPLLPFLDGALIQEVAFARVENTTAKSGNCT